MSLWSKPISEVTFEDVEEFCQAEWKEGVRLDYKRDIPRDLPALVASFANTLGGLIIFGVDVDRATNKPIWPPAGIPRTKGFSERVTQICDSGIYPPILPGIGGPLSDPNRSQAAVAVVRVDQSPEAPHAIQNKTQICIRTGDTTKRIDLADIDRIEQMLQTRKQSEAKASYLRERHLTRCRFLVHQYYGAPTVWWHIGPLYPTRPVCQLDSCRVPGIGADRRGPDGAWGLHEHAQRQGRQEKTFDGYTGTTIYGDLFVANRLVPSHDGEQVLSVDDIEWRTRNVMADVWSFLSRNEVECPGMLRINIGFQDVRGKAMLGQGGRPSGAPCPDDALEAEVIATFEEFAESPFSSEGVYPRVLCGLLSDVVHAFDLRWIHAPS